MGSQGRGNELRVIERESIVYLVGLHCPDPGRSVGFASSLGCAQKFESLLAFSLFCFLALMLLTQPDSSHLLVS